MKDFQAETTKAHILSVQFKQLPDIKPAHIIQGACSLKATRAVHYSFSMKNKSLLLQRLTGLFVALSRNTAKMILDLLVVIF